MPACQGLRAIEIGSGFSATALTGQLLAKLGAEVVLLEPKGGDPLRLAPPLGPDGTGHLFHLLADSKQSLAVDTGHPGTPALLADLLRWADVVLVDQPTAAWCGLTPDRFAEDRPETVGCFLSPFGYRSNYRHWAGNELLVQAMSGIVACTGYPGGLPNQAGIPLATHTAALYAFTAVMTALEERSQSGLGQSLDLSVMDCMISLLGNFMPGYFLNGESPERVGNRHLLSAPWNIYPTSDGYVIICSGNDRWWDATLQAVGRPDLVGDPRFATIIKRVENVDAVDAVLSAWTSRHTTTEVEVVFEGINIPVGRIVPIEEVLKAEQFRQVRRLVLPGTTAAGDPITLSGIPLPQPAEAVPATAAPALGNGGVGLLSAIGYSSERISALVDAGVLGAGHGGGRHA